jgi:hypothetical protein
VPDAVAGYIGDHGLYARPQPAATQLELPA